MSKLISFFENIYWYVFKKIKINDTTKLRAYKLLTDSCNGKDSILSSLILKTSHMLYNISKSSYEEERYISTCDIWKNRHNLCFQHLINENLRKSDHNKPFNIMDVELKDDTNRFEVRYLYKGVIDNGLLKVYEVKPKLDGFYDDIVLEKEEIITRKEPHYTYHLEKGYITQILTLNDFVYDYEHFEELTKSIEDYITKTYGDKAKASSNYIYNLGGCIVIDPEIYKELDNCVKVYVKGRILSYHTLWNFRKQIKKLYEYDTLDEENYEIYKRELKNKCNYINDIFIKYSDSWWI